LFDEELAGRFAGQGRRIVEPPAPKSELSQLPKTARQQKAEVGQEKPAAMRLFSEVRQDIRDGATWKAEVCQVFPDPFQV